MIFSQKKYAVTYFPLRLWNMGDINFSAVATKCLTIGDIRSKVSLTFWVICHSDIYDLFPRAWWSSNNVEPTASFNIMWLFLTINFRDETWRGKRIKRTGKFWFRPSERTKHDHSQYKRSFSREGVFTIWQKTACRRIFGKSSGDLQRIHTAEW